jgi:hypothetical protein
MLVSISTEQEVSTTNLSHKLRSLPTLIEVYVLLVDQVMRKHGFDPERCEFLAEQALPPVEAPGQDSIQGSSAPWLGVSRTDFLIATVDAEWSSFSDTPMTSSEEELLAVAV